MTAGNFGLLSLDGFPVPADRTEAAEGRTTAVIAGVGEPAMAPAS